MSSSALFEAKDNEHRLRARAAGRKPTRARRAASMGGACVLEHVYAPAEMLARARTTSRRGVATDA